ncbi:hypothetical protein [Mycobacterium branderi]|uniref:hypothetical protein n=1 Tax=Mycobacterium branderi TaxID=43348 RepID=UPI001E5C4602|nr:hypothetical protein [Mycobacterium branderi]
MPLSEAAARLNKDPRTVIRAITTGRIRGGALPRPERLRWYVYEDELPGRPAPTPPPVSDALVDDLRAQLVSQMEANRLLIAAQQELLAADENTRGAAERYRAAAQQYLDALSQFVTPGHLGDLGLS